MNRLVLVTGFANPASSAERVASALADYFNYEDFDYATLGDAIAEPARLDRIIKNADVFTHSAGLVALKGSRPKSMHAFNPPLESSRPRLAAQTLLRHRTEKALQDNNEPLRLDTGFVREAVSHPIRHLRPFFTGIISSFNPITAAIEARNGGVDVGLAYTDADCYSHPTDEQVAQLRSEGVQVAQIDGVHDELLLRPAEAVDRYFMCRY